MCDKNCDTFKQCCAPIEPIKNFPLIENKNVQFERCPNKIYKGYHCEDHFKKANELYKQYKKTCKIAYKLHPEKVNITINDIPTIQENIKYLFKCYIWYKNAYENRMKHRNYAFTPETSDYGHNKQFILIQDKINICNDRLELLYDKLKNIDIVKKPI